MKVSPPLARGTPLVSLTTYLGGGGGGSQPGAPNQPPAPPGHVPFSTGSNVVAWGSNVAIITSNGSNQLNGPFVNFTSGAGITFSAASNTLTINATGAAAAAASNALLRTTGGAGAVTTIASSGAAKTLMVGGANTFDITLTANCVIALSGAALTGSESNILLILRQDGSGNRTVTWPGSVVWAGGSAPTLSTGASEVDFVVLETIDGGSVWFGFPVGGNSGSSSPLTTKGDLWGYSTVDARVAVGSNGTTVYADSAQTLGLRWTNQAIHGELLMQDGVTAPPVPIENELQDDWLYADL